MSGGAPETPRTAAGRELVEGIFYDGGHLFGSTRADMTRAISAIESEARAEARDTVSAAMGAAARATPPRHWPSSSWKEAFLEALTTPRGLPTREERIQEPGTSGVFGRAVWPDHAAARGHDRCPVCTHDAHRSSCQVCNIAAVNGPCAEDGAPPDEPEYRPGRGPAPQGHGKPVEPLPRPIVCDTCDHPRALHSTGAMCSGGGDPCYCVIFPEHIVEVPFNA